MFIHKKNYSTLLAMTDNSTDESSTRAPPPGFYVVQKLKC